MENARQTLCSIKPRSEFCRGPRARLSFSPPRKETWKERWLLFLQRRFPTSGVAEPSPRLDATWRRDDHRKLAKLLAVGTMVGSPV
jgi:hypothetical protein